MGDNYIQIGNKKIGDSHPCFIIAEIGQNHQGDINIAKILIDIAKDTGVDCVKFQKNCLEEKFTKAVLESKYESANSWGETYGKHKRFLEFTDDQYLDLQAYAKAKDILFTASVMDPVSLKFISSLGVPFIKIGSGDSDNLLLMEEAAKTQIPLVISTGYFYPFKDEAGVKQVYERIRPINENFVFLHCVSAYPTPPQEANLTAIQSLKKLFPNVIIGYSGHEVGYNLTLAAVALGAKVVERHITIDKTWKGSDHKCSLEPHELRTMIQSIREIESSLGNGIKRILDCELDCIRKLGKCIVSAHELPAGSVLTKEDLKIKVAQTENGLAPRGYFDTIEFFSGLFVPMLCSPKMSSTPVDDMRLPLCQTLK